MYELGENIIDNCGNKAMFLSMLKAKGYNIPLGIVIDFKEFKKMVKEQNLNFDTISELKIPDEIIDKIFDIIPKEKLIAVRSSASIEDERKYSLGICFTDGYASLYNINPVGKFCWVITSDGAQEQDYPGYKICIPKIIK